MLWTNSSEVVERPATEAEALAAQLAAVALQLKLRAQLALRITVNESLDAEEYQINQRLQAALDIAQKTKVVVHARVGYDLERGEVVLADKDGTELRRRPCTEAEKRIAAALKAPQG